MHRGWLLVSNAKNWEIAKNRSVFGLHRKPSYLEDLKKGDIFITYIPGIGLIDSGEVASNVFVDKKRVWKNKIYPYRFKMKIRKTGIPVDPRNILDKLSFVTNKGKWGLFFRAGIRQIPRREITLIHDYQKKLKAIDITREGVPLKVRKIKSGNPFQDKIAELFAAAGFEIVDNNYNKLGPDITVEDPQNELKLIIQCKKAQRNQKAFLGLDALVKEYAEWVRETGADKAILILSGYSIPDTHDLIRFDKEKDVVIWGDDYIDQYKKLIKAIGPYGKYQIFADLGVNRNFASPIETEAFHVKQNNSRTSYYAFKVSPGWLLKTASVLRRVQDNGTPNYQRILEASRVKKISKFLERDYWSLPNSIILCTNSNLSKNSIKFKKNKLSLPSTLGGYWIMDGQHRLYGFSRRSATEQENNELLCTLFVSDEMGSESFANQAATFIDINGNAKKVSTALLLELLQQYQLLGMKDYPALPVVTKLAKTRIFEGLVNGYSNKGGSISLPTFVTNQAMKDLFSDKSPFANKKGDLKKTSKLVEKNLKLYFNLVGKVFHNIWGNLDYGLSSDRGIRGLLRLYLKAIAFYGKVPSKTQLTKILKALRNSGFDFSSSNFGQYNGEQGAKALLGEWESQISAEIPGFSTRLPARSIPIPKDENEQAEFKQTLRWNIKNSKVDDVMLHEVLLTVDAFLNSEGGRVFIGISDAGEVVGIEKDLKVFGSNLNEAKDKLKLYLGNQLRDKYNPSINNLFSYKTELHDDKEILIIEVKKAEKPIYVKINGKEEFYYREINRSRKLEGAELNDYISRRFR